MRDWCLRCRLGPEYWPERVAMRNRCGWTTLVVAVGVLAGACQAPPAPPTPEPAELAPAPVGTVKDLMKGLQATAVKAIAAARAHDKDAILAVGSEIDNACESCHKAYWYPDEKIPEVPANAPAAAPGAKPRG